MPVDPITVQNLGKTYRVPVRAEGLLASFRSLGRRQYQEVVAVQDVSFSIQSGEMVGFIGPNGAGKTTTLKMLAGLLHPSAGEAQVLGFRPWERDPAYLARISMVLGNKSQMLWDIPPLDTFRVLGEIYRLPPAQFRQTVDELVALLEMQALLPKPVRTLSLGERMKCELVAALLHRPQVLFLDEPTLGLDVSMQGRLRQFFKEYNRRSGVTVILTSHYMADVTALCPRVILIHQGGLLYDGDLSALAQKLAPFKLLQVALRPGVEQPDPTTSLPASVELVERQDGQLTLRVARAEAPALTAYLLQNFSVADLSVADPPIEAVIDQVYRQPVREALS
ncbi:MAG: ATP-binding cassette domain-containing protein [Anaerolineales bacterium]|nr:ATP-binding cassette domain-containing protein [Anaerolineales bacterium]